MDGKRRGLSRREFVLNSAKIATATAALTCSTDLLAHLRYNGHGQFSILQGATSETTAQFSIDLPKNASVRIQAVSEFGTIITPELHSSEVREFSEWRVDQVVFVDLMKNHPYQLQVIGSNGELLDFRQFGTLDFAKQNPKIAILSCMRETAGSIHEMWRGIKIHQPDLMFFIGDNVYGDLRGVGPEKLWNMYISTRRIVPFYHNYQMIPVLATWDDHDYGKNNAQGDYVNKADSLKSFHAFFAQDEKFNSNLIAGPTLSKAFSIYGNQFFLFDGRSYRNSEKDKMLDHEQLEWFIAQKETNTGEPIWLINGSQFFGGYAKKESYEYQAPGEFNYFLEQVSNWQSPAIFISGDRHFSEVMEIEKGLLGYTSLELTSSSMHSITRPWGGKNPRRRSIHNFKNFMLLTLDRSQNGIHANLKIISQNGNIKLDEMISVIKA